VSPARAGQTGPGGRSGDAHIDRLVLRVAGLDEDAARALARLVAEGLAAGLPRAAGAAGLDALRLEVAATGAEQKAPDLLARRITDAIGRTLARDRTDGGDGAPDGRAAP
jgi:hypothetical protein